MSIQDNGTNPIWNRYLHSEKKLSKIKELLSPDSKFLAIVLECKTKKSLEDKWGEID